MRSYVSVTTPESSPHKILVYGQPGAGKTTFGLSANQHDDLADVLVINVDGGLQGHTGVLQVPGEGQQFKKKMLSWVTSQLIQPKDRRVEELRHVKTVFIDSVNSMRDRLMFDAMEENPNPIAKMHDVPQLHQYMQVNNAIIKFTSDLYQAGVHVILSVQEKDETLGETVIGKNVALTPYMTGIFGAFTSAIFYLTQSRKGVYSLWFGGGKHFTKVRGAKFNERLFEYSRSEDNVLNAGDGARIESVTGSIVIPNAEFPTMRLIHNLYKGA